MEQKTTIWHTNKKIVQEALKGKKKTKMHAVDIHGTGIPTFFSTYYEKNFIEKGVEKIKLWIKND